MKTTLNTVIQFNPSERLKKGETCRKVAMEHVHVFSRSITEWENVTYNGGTKFRNGDTLLARITPCLENGKTAMVSFLNDGEVACGSTEFIVLRAIKGKTDPFFVYYLAISKLFRDLAIKSMVGSTGRQRVQQNVIENAIMEVPTLTEQKKIVAVLSALDSKIELNTQINQNLEQQAQAIFKSWFVDFEPFQDGKFVDSECGPVPEGWQVGTLKEMLDIRYGKDHKKLSEGKVPVYGSGGLMRLVDKALYSGESVLIPRKGTLNNVMRVTGDFWTVDTMFYSVPKRKGAAKFAFHILHNMDLASMNSGSAVPSMTTDILNSIVIVVPPQSVLDSFDETTKALWELHESNLHESSRLATLRDTLLPKLMSGEIDVSEVAV